MEEFISTECCFKLKITRISKSKLDQYPGWWNFCTRCVTFMCFQFERLCGHGKGFTRIWYSISFSKSMRLRSVLLTVKISIQHSYFLFVSSQLASWSYKCGKYKHLFARELLKSVFVERKLTINEFTVGQEGTLLKIEKPPSRENWISTRRYRWWQGPINRDKNFYL